jgi:hypothetical protein
MMSPTTVIISVAAAAIGSKVSGINSKKDPLPSEFKIFVLGHDKKPSQFVTGAGSASCARNPAGYAATAAMKQNKKRLFRIDHVLLILATAQSLAKKCFFANMIFSTKSVDNFVDNSMFGDKNSE